MPKVVDERTYVDTPLNRAIVYHAKRNAFSVRALGEKAGMSGDGVRNILRGTSTSPRRSTLEALAAVLGVTLYDLTEGGRDLPPVGSGAPAVPLGVPVGSRDTPYVTVVERGGRPARGSPAGPSLELLPRVDDWRIPRRLLAEWTGTPQDLLMLTVPAGWEPLAQAGDRLLVDTGWKEPSPGLWITWDGWAHHLVRLSASGPGKLTDGAREVQAGELEVSGRVLARWGWT